MKRYRIEYGNGLSDKNLIASFVRAASPLEASAWAKARIGGANVKFSVTPDE